MDGGRCSRHRVRLGRRRRRRRRRAPVASPTAPMRFWKGERGEALAKVVARHSYREAKLEAPIREDIRHLAMA